MFEVVALLLEPLSFPFMQRGLLAAMMVGIVCATVGSFMVLRGMAFFGDALAHTILPGVAIGYLLAGGPGAAQQTIFWSALGAAVVAALLIGAIARGAPLKEDTAIGIVFAGMFALGIALISSVRSFAVDLTHFLFGNVLGVGPTDLWLISIFGGLVVLTIVFLYPALVAVSFDEVHAATLKLPVQLLNSLLLTLIAVAIVVSLQTVGIALMLAMLITPAATARLLTRSLPFMLALAALIGASSGAVGLYTSFYVNIASGAAIVLVSTALFGLAFLFVRWRGRGMAAAN